MNEREAIRLAMQVAAAEETARISSLRMRKLIAERKWRPIYKKTNFLELTMSEARGRLLIADIKGPGELIELIAISKSPKYRLVIQLDEVTISKKFEELEELSQLTKSVAAFKEDDRYVLNVAGLSWSKLLTIFVSTESEPIIFDKIICIYNTFNSS